MSKAKVALAVLALLLLAWLGVRSLINPEPDQAGTAAQTTAPPGAGPGPAGPTSSNAPTVGDYNEAGETFTYPPAVWDEIAAARAEAAALTALTAYLDTGAGESAWREQLEPLLSPAAVSAYRTVGVRSIPAAAVVEDPRLADGSDPPPSAYVVQVVIGTSIGEFGVLLSRSDGAAPWLVERFEWPTR